MAPAYDEILPHDHYARKNMGYLYAIRAGYSVIVESDDDNIPSGNDGDGGTNHPYFADPDYMGVAPFGFAYPVGWYGDYGNWNNDNRGNQGGYHGGGGGGHGGR